MSPSTAVPSSTATSVSSTLAHVRRTLAMLIAVDRALVVALVVVAALDAATLVAIAWVGKHVIDAIVVAARAPTHPTAAPLRWVLLEFGLIVLRAANGQFGGYANVALRAKLGLHVNLRILEKAIGVDYASFEDPAFADRLSNARRDATARPVDLVQQCLSILRSGLTLAGYLGLIVALGWWAVPLLVLTAIPPFVAEARHGRALFRLQRARTARNRRAFYLESVLTQEQTQKEVKLFALGRWLVERYREVHQDFASEEAKLAARHALEGIVVGLISQAALYGTYAFIVGEAVRSVITLGAMTLYLTVFRQGQATVQSALGSVAKLYEHDLFMSNLFEYLSMPERDPEPPWSDLRPGAQPPRIDLRAVTYRYPGAAEDSLHEVNLTLEPGEALALVGKNGAGKTTLIKLLTGLYEPTSGAIFIDGRDAREIPLAERRAMLGVIFQDFSKFQFSARENVGVGWLPARTDDAAIGRAVEAGGASEVIARLPRGLDTALGRAFGGDDLSIGQWQRVALSRAFMRKSPVLVLDEPTASMDAEAEAEIFGRFRALREGRTALLVTHRFATARMADKIVVLERGRVLEYGTHAQLMERDGRYAGMFRLQAAGYRDEDVAVVDPRDR